jgi:hypothetical protein
VEGKTSGARLQAAKHTKTYLQTQSKVLQASSLQNDRQRTTRAH